MAAVTVPIRSFAPMAPRPPRSGGDAGPLSHAVRISFADAGQAALAAERFAAAARSWGPAGAAGSPRLWLEDVAAPSTGPRAVRRRNIELSRAIGPVVQPPMRGVMLRYRDGRADMIIICHRAFMSEAALRHLSALVADLPGGDHPPPAQPAVAPEQGRAPGPPTPPWAVPSWACGIPEAGDRSASSRFRLAGAATRGDLATWLTALAVVLRRYDGDGSSTAAALGLAGMGETSALVLAWADRELALEDLTGQIRTALRRSGGSSLHAASPERSAPAIGLVFASGDGLPGGRTSVEYHPYQVPIFPLTIAITVDGDRAGLRCDYRPRDFAPAMVRQFARHLTEVHRQVIEAPERQVAEVELLDRGERTRVAAMGRSVSPQHGQEARIHELIAAHARTHPRSPALSDGERRMGYAELDARADLLARGLRALGVRGGERVGTCLERSAGLVIALLAVLKAGAAYVPMDPGYPEERLAYMVGDAGLRIVIAHGVPGQFPADSGVRVITPDDLADLGDLGADSRPGPPASVVVAADPAYVIYTSGSTGRPKGVVVPHANVVALVDATRDQYELGPSDVWTLFHSSAFDFSVWEIWGCLLTGGHLIVVPFWVSRTPDEFRALLAGEKVTVLSQTPSAFGQLLKADRAELEPLAVRLIVFGGESLDARMLLPWFDRHPESACRVVNMFGITETTVHVTAQTLTRRHALERSRSVGRPLPGWQVSVMDSEQRLVPPGVAGEICVAGAGVSLGYLNRPELTSQRFWRDPRTGERVYRSGDKGRMRLDGTLEHLGRLDRQVKVRGFRVELDEIRTVLLESPDVTAAAVVVTNADRKSVV